VVVSIGSPYLEASNPSLDRTRIQRRFVSCYFYAPRPSANALAITAFPHA
jgi:hypothetical protein